MSQGFKKSLQNAMLLPRKSKYEKDYRRLIKEYEERAEKIEAVDGILLDLGVSSPQLDDATRGFSFRADGPLDMRMDRACALTAADIVNTRTEDELAGILRTYGEEPAAKRIACAIVRARASRPAGARTIPDAYPCTSARSRRSSAPSGSAPPRRSSRSRCACR